jgi:hypothetical protein
LKEAIRIAKRPSIPGSGDQQNNFNRFTPEIPQDHYSTFCKELI